MKPTAAAPGRCLQVQANDASSVRTRPGATRTEYLRGDEQLWCAAGVVRRGSRLRAAVHGRNSWPLRWLLLICTVAVAQEALRATLDS